MAPNPPRIGPRNPRATDYYRCVEDHLETFIQDGEERFERAYEFFRPYPREVIYRYLDCGNLHNGFARVKCADCNHESLLALSCNRLHFCSSCPQNRVVEFGEWLCANVLKKVPLRHFKRIFPKDQTSLENLARYTIRASFSQERMRYLADEGTVIYAANDGNDRKVFDAGEGLAAMCPRPESRRADGPVLRPVTETDVVMC